MKIRSKQINFLIGSCAACYPAVDEVRGSQDYDIEHKTFSCPSRDFIYGPLQLDKDEIIDVNFNEPNSFDFDYVRNNKIYYFRSSNDEDFFDKFEIISN